MKLGQRLLMKRMKYDRNVVVLLSLIVIFALSESIYMCHGAATSSGNSKVVNTLINARGGQRRRLDEPSNDDKKSKDDDHDDGFDDDHDYHDDEHIFDTEKPTEIPSLPPSTLLPASTDVTTEIPSLSPITALPTTAQISEYSMPTSLPTSTPPTANITVTYRPGELNTVENGITLSEGLTAKLIGATNFPVRYSDGTLSDDRYVTQPDAGATFPDPRPGNEGGWIYTQNSEYRPPHNETLTQEQKNQGGVGAITFDKYGNIIHYQKVLNNSRANCGGGRTPWGVSQRAIG